MYLLVKPNGKKFWRLKYRFGGKEKTFSIGEYDQVTLSEARDRRSDAKKLLDQGIDPSQAKKKEKREISINALNSFESVALAWHEHNKHTWSKKHAADIWHRIKEDVLPSLGKRPIADIDGLELLDTIKGIEKRGAHELAHRTLQYCGRIFRYAVLHKMAKANPANGLVDALKPVVSTHFAAFEIKDLPEFLEKLRRNSARLYTTTILSVEFIMLTFVRTKELINARWNEFDIKGKMWTIPAERMKMRRSHLVPLSTQAIKILEQLKNLREDHTDDSYVFPNQVFKDRCMSNNTILGAIEKLGYQGRMTGHGFRALAMTACKEKLGYRHEVVDRQLAHACQSACKNDPVSAPNFDPPFGLFIDPGLATFDS